ncbi:MAG: efflux RND transporter periplasmic adaptor subunit [Myxococcales bacterium]|nr:efflux RND transporter periplasmic adaptor subunit [Myxococcales bacterium]
MSERATLRRNLRYGVYALLGAGFVGAVYLASQPKPEPVDTAAVTRGRLTVVVEDDGRTRVSDRYTISAPIAGSLARIALEPGDAVAADDVVAHLNAMEVGLLDTRTRAQAQASIAAAVASQARVRAEVARAETAAQFAQREQARLDALVDSGGVARANVDRARYEAQSAAEALQSARFAARVADHEVGLARASLTRSGDGEVLPVLSPVEGVVLRVLTESAGVVQAGQPLLEVGDPRRLEVVVDVLTTEAVAVEVGDPVELVRWGGVGSLHGRVRVKEPSAFTTRSALGVEEQRVSVVIELQDPPEARAGLADGYRVEARIEVDAADDVLRVPASALFRDGEGWAVYAVRAGVARKVAVELGLENADFAEVRSGLSEGDVVIVHPGDAIHDGVLVTARL